MALIHYAAMYNRPQIIAVWIIMALDINIKKVTNATIHGQHFTIQDMNLTRADLCLEASFLCLYSFLLTE